MSAISGAFSTPFGTSGDLGVGTASILGGNATGTPNAASILSAGTTSQSAVFTALLNSVNTSASSPTLQALNEGKLTTKQHQALAAIAGGTDLKASFNWNDNGTEPSVLAQIRQYGWIKLVAPQYNSTTRLTTGATYTLTELGKAIVVRTGGAQVTSSSNTANSNTVGNSSVNLTI